MERRIKNGVLKFKKGNAIADSIVFLVVIFAFAIVILNGKTIFDDINTDIQADLDLSSEATEISSNLNTRYPATFDSALIMIFFLLWIAIIVASFRIDAHPWFFAVVGIALLFVLVAAGILGNAYEEIEADLPVSSSFILTHFIMSNIFITFMIVAFTVVIALYMKGKV